MPAAPSPRPLAARAASYRRIFRLARPEVANLAAGTFFLALSSGATLVVPQRIGHVVDKAIAPGVPVAALDHAALLLLIAFAVNGVASALRYALFTISGERVVARLRERLFAKVMEQDIAFFDERKTGELTSRLASDTAVLQNAVSVNISMGLRFVATIVGGIGFLFYTSPQLTALMLAVVPPIALGAVAYGRRVRKLSRDVQDALAGASEVAEEATAPRCAARSISRAPAPSSRPPS
jgi:ABC-type multidrug transport system fused ATPase/permease subunit